MRVPIRELAAMLNMQAPEPKFKEGQRVFFTAGADEGYEQPEGTVLFPGPVTTVVLDHDWRWPEEDTGLREVSEDKLCLIQEQVKE